MILYPSLPLIHLGEYLILMIESLRSIAEMQGAEFEYPGYPPTTDMNAVCVGFRGTFWYHLGFSARPVDATAETQHFFAELYFDRRWCQIAVETCTILGTT